MVKKIVWTQTAVQDRIRIYQFWLSKNKSDLFSRKLEMLFNEAAVLLSEFPEIGTQTDYQDIRVKVIRNYKLYYQISTDYIQIIRVWDTRQSPDNLQIG